MKEFQKKIEEQMNYLNEYITTINTNMEDGFIESLQLPTLKLSI